jgi:hypothetical protein
MTVSLCEFDRHISSISSWYHQLVISTDTSACYHHLVTRVISTETSACYHHPVSSTGTYWYHHLVSSTDTSWYHHLVSWFRTVCSDFQNLRLGAIEFGMRWGSSCEFDRVGPTHHHDIIILWVRHSIIILIVRETHHFVISTDTSSWHPHLVIRVRPNDTALCCKAGTHAL